MATGPSSLKNPFGPYNVDYNGNVNVAKAAANAGLKKIVMVSSIGAEDWFFFLNRAWDVMCSSPGSGRGVGRGMVGFSGAPSWSPTCSYMPVSQCLKASTTSSHALLPTSY